jgi:hypothetical protein
MCPHRIHLGSYGVHEIEDIELRRAKLEREEREAFAMIEAEEEVKRIYYAAECQARIDWMLWQLEQEPIQAEMSGYYVSPGCDYGCASNAYYSGSIPKYWSETVQLQPRAQAAHLLRRQYESPYDSRELRETPGYPGALEKECDYPACLGTKRCYCWDLK